MPRAACWRLTGAVLAGVLFAGCASTSNKAETSLRPAPQQPTRAQVVGEAVVASIAGVSTTVRWLDRGGVEAYFAARPGLVVPWPKEEWKDNPPTMFLLRLHNQTREEVQFDPALVSLIAQNGRRELPLLSEDIYLRLGDVENAGPRLQSLQATLFSRFVVLRPNGQRDGLLLFRSLPPETKFVSLELASFFVGGRSTPARFDFQVLREPAK
jgi:hypothetical protein